VQSRAGCLPFLPSCLHVCVWLGSVAPCHQSAWQGCTFPPRRIRCQQPAGSGPPARFHQPRLPSTRSCLLLGPNSCIAILPGLHQTHPPTRWPAGGKRVTWNITAEKSSVLVMVVSQEAAFAACPLSDGSNRRECCPQPACPPACLPTVPCPRAHRSAISYIGRQTSAHPEQSAQPPTGSAYVGAWACAACRV